MAEAGAAGARPCLCACATAAVPVERAAADDPARRVCRQVQNNFLTGSVPPALLNMTKKWSIPANFK
jgi:hypothetical protein